MADCKQRVFEKSRLLSAELKRDRKLQTPTRPLDLYAGKYYNGMKNLFIEVTVSGTDRLIMWMPGFYWTAYTLAPYDVDQFFWEYDYDTEMECAIFPFVTMSKEFHAVKFTGQDSKQTERLVWRYAEDLPSSEEVFSRRIGA